jgi:hypothetical protein
MGAAPTAPQGQSRFGAGRLAQREWHLLPPGSEDRIRADPGSPAGGSDGRSEGAHNLALNSNWIFLGSV